MDKKFNIKEWKDTQEPIKESNFAPHKQAGRALNGQKIKVKLLKEIK